MAYNKYKPMLRPDPHFNFPNPKTRLPEERRVQRVLEMIPGLLTWTTLLGMLGLSFFLPVWAAVVVILFDIYWIYRALYISLFSLQAQWSIVKAKRLHWLERCQEIQNPKEYMAALEIQRQKLLAQRRALP